jgi:hypothetical protein
MKFHPFIHLTAFQVECRDWNRVLKDTPIGVTNLVIPMPAPGAPWHDTWLELSKPNSSGSAGRLHLRVGFIEYCAVELTSFVDAAS